MKPSGRSVRCGLVGNIQGYSTEDGPGIRTTVFLMGCPLRCRWCSNPEFLKPEPVTMVFGNGQQRVGEWMSPDTLSERLLRDRIFYEESDGGVTFSGGEAASQAEFVLACARLLHKEGIHVCLDTSGCCDARSFSALLSGVDLVLFDLKAADPMLHKALTGRNNAQILENLSILGASRVSWRLRLVVVPGCNDDRKDLELRLRMAASLENPPEAVDVLLYHSLGEGKYAALGLPYSLPAVPAPDSNLKDWVQGLARTLGLQPGRFG
ncbi:radical SAM protein [Faecalibaculum rodentium]|uniref:radical SAM protein n=1 Tax=Faecalibaculum rodentium TaxID=1702221 RepID=UPI00262FAEB3|nr:radical SAM protein [Faecalibaculum rodentium]